MNATEFLDAGARIEARRIEGDGSSDTTLVFLHEGLGSITMWRDFPDRVSKACGLGALVYSRRGYGASEPAKLPRPITFMHEEAYESLPRVLDAAGVKRAILVGHSDGASIALLHAAWFPTERIAGVVAIAPHVFVEEITVASTMRLREAYATTDLRARLGRYHADVDAVFRGWSDVWIDPDFRAWNIEREVEQIRAPILVIQGQNDEYGTLAHLESIARHGLAVTTCILDGAGHSPHKDRPEETCDAIVRFASGLVTRARLP